MIGDGAEPDHGIYTLLREILNICLVLLASTMVTRTSGSMPIFMIAEPVTLLATVIGFVFLRC